MKFRDTPSDFDIMKNSIVKSIIRFRWIVFIVFTISTMAALASTAKMVNRYKANATIRMERDISEATSEIGLMTRFSMGNSYFVNPIFDQIALLNSRIVTEGVVRRLYRNFKITMSNYYGNFNYKILWLSENPEYRNLRLNILKDNIYKLYSNDSFEEELLLDSGKIYNHEDTIKINFLSFTFSVNPNDTGEIIIKILPIEQIAEGLKNEVEINSITQTNIFILSVTDTNPDQARRLVNAYAREMVEFDVQRGRSNARNVREFIEEQLVLTNKSLEEAEKELKAIQEEFGWLTAETQENRVETQISTLLGQKIQVQIEIRALEEEKRTIKEELDGNGAYSVYTEAQHIPELTSNQTIQNLQARLNLKEDHRAELLGRYTEGHPKVLELDSTINYLKNEMQQKIQDLTGNFGTGPVDNLWTNLVNRYIFCEVELNSKYAYLSSINRILESIRGELDSLPTEISRYERIYRRVDVEQETYTMLLEKLQEAKISEATQVGYISMLDSALTPLSPVGPGRKKNIFIGAFVGIFLGIILAYILDKFDTSIREAEDIEINLGMDVLGIIPDISLNEKKSNIKENISDEEMAKKIEKQLIIHAAPKSPAAESYRSLRTNIQFSSVKDPIKTLVIVSALPKEGKSTTVSNLAATIAQQGLKTLLIDTDLRKPVLHHVFNIDRAPGIIDYLLGNCKIDQAVKKTSVENLFVLPCGTIPPNPAEIISSEKMKKFIAEITRVYGFVLFDSPPLLAVTDGALLSSEVDATAMVLRAEKTDKEAAKISMKLLKNVNANLIGAIFNNINMTKRYGYQYYYRYYYQYNYVYGDKTGEQKRKKNIFLHMKDFFQ